MIIDNQTALVLEGGGFRGVFTCGVLDNFMQRNLTFPFTVGVSAGACNGLSYMSKQEGRAKRSNIDLMEEYDYVGLKYLLQQRCIMDFKLLFEKFPQQICPYDYETYFANSDRFVMVTTNCLTGEANYFEEKKNPERVIDIVRASSSLPFVAPIAYVDGIPMLDGGIADSLPIEYAQKQGYKKQVVVLTRNKGYRKKETNPILLKPFYRKYPNLQQAIINRNKIYNKTMEKIERLEDEGKILVIRPINPIKVGRIEKNITRLIELYDEGFRIANEIEFQMNR